MVKWDLLDLLASRVFLGYQALLDSLEPKERKAAVILQTVWAIKWTTAPRAHLSKAPGKILQDEGKADWNKETTAFGEGSKPKTTTQSYSVRPHGRKQKFWLFFNKKGPARTEACKDTPTENCYWTIFFYPVHRFNTLRFFISQTTLYFFLCFQDSKLRKESQSVFSFPS